MSKIAMSRQSRDIDRHEVILNGKPPLHPGLLTRTDRLEQVEARRNWHIRALWTVGGGFVLEPPSLSISRGKECH